MRLPPPRQRGTSPARPTLVPVQIMPLTAARNDVATLHQSQHRNELHKHGRHEPEPWITGGYTIEHTKAVG
jgi:hypothetical protein